MKNSTVSHMNFENRKSLDIWQIQIDRALKESNLSLENYTKSYLAQVLNQQMLNQDLVGHNAISRLWLDALEEKNFNKKKIQDTGDRCLIICGLFPNQAQIRNTSITHYITIGKTAYASLANHNANPSIENSLFLELNHKFIAISQTIAIMKRLKKNQNSA